MRDGDMHNLTHCPRPSAPVMRTDWGFVHQDAREGLRMGVSAGANVGERLMAIGDRHYGKLREAGTDWLARVEIDPAPSTISAQLLRRHAPAVADRPRAGIEARLVFMDEPTGGLDVSVRHGCWTCCGRWCAT